MLDRQHDRTITSATAREIALELDTRSTEFDTDAQRCRYCLENTAVDTFGDYLLATLLVDVPEYFDIDTERLYGTDTTEELLDETLEVFVEQLALREAFSTVSIDTPATVCEALVTEPPETTPVVSEDDAFPKAEMGYESVTIDRMRYRALHQPSDTRVVESYADELFRCIRTIHDEMFTTINPDPYEIHNLSAEPHEAILDAQQEIYEANFQPDIAFVGDLDRFDHTEIGETTVREAPLLADSYCAIVDSDHFGYETIWNDFDYDVYENFERMTPFGSQTIRVSYSGNFVSIQDNACVHGYLRAGA
jgi:hypothetical protein